MSKINYRKYSAEHILWHTGDIPQWDLQWWHVVHCASEKLEILPINWECHHKQGAKKQETPLGEHEIPMYGYR